MPVVLGNEAPSLSLPSGRSPTGETNGIDVPDSLTDVEDLLSDGDHSPIMKRKYLSMPQQDKGAITDTEDMDLSGEEDEFIQEKNNLPTIQDLGLLPEPIKEVINLTEGFAREPSPLLSDSEQEAAEDVQGRHKKNLKKMESLSELQIPDENVEEGLTDVEDMVASGEEVDEAAEALEDSLPDHYLDQGEGVSNKEKLNAVTPAPKIFLTREDDSSDEEQDHRQKSRRKARTLKVEVKEDGTTDVEDLVVSDKGEEKTQVVNETKDKPKKKKLVRRKVIKKPSSSKTLSTSATDEDALTDVEILTGDDEAEEEWVEEDESYLAMHDQDDGATTDYEGLEASDTEDIESFVPKAIEKITPAVIPEPHAEKVRINETEEKEQEVSGDETDEEGFVIEDKDDEKPLIPRKRVSHEPIVTIQTEALDVEEPCEPVLTDTEDFDIEDKEEDEIMQDVLSRIPEEGEIYTIQEIEAQMGNISKREMIKDVNAGLKQQIKEAELAGLTLQEALNDETLTDVEDLDDEQETKSKRKQKKTKKDDQNDQTDEESVEESDVEEEIRKPTKQLKGRGKRLPLAPQISEVRFIETEQGPLSIIVTPDTIENNPHKIPKDQVANVVFLECEEKDTTTDVEELGLSDEEGEHKTSLKTPVSTQEPTTDTEDLDIDPTDLERPHSPLPPNIQQCVFSSPKREIIHIKEDKYGVPQVSIRKLGNDELTVSDFEDAGVTDTEDIEVSEGEALRIIGVTEDSTSDFELSDSGKTEVSTKMVQKEGLQVELEEDGNTDVEELSLTKKRRKPKSNAKLIPKVQGEDSHTDVELLSDQEDKSNLKVRVESPGAHTDLEDFETSEGEELELPTREKATTPDVIKNAAIKRVVILKEGPDGVTKTEEVELAPERKNLLQAEDDPEGVTDVEDMEASGAEEEDHEADYPAVELPCHESSNVDISEKSILPKANNEENLIKDNLLLPEDNYNNLTDVESLSEGEGNRCASNTNLLSSQQLTYAVESCTVEELSYHLPSTDPKLCVHPGVSLERDPFCGELTSPLVVEAELEQVYYHAPKEDAHKNELELEASDGCVVRKRQVVASLCQAREIRRFWSLDRNSPLHQSEISAFATPTMHKKGFKTILYLEQPNLLDTISISDTLCDSGYFRNERLLDFDSSSIDSFDDHFSYRDSDIVTVVDRFNQERGSSFDDLPSPHLSSIGSSGIIDSLCSGRSFGSDIQFCDTPPSPRPCSSHSRYSSEDLRKDSDLTLSLSGISGQSFSPDTSLHQELELSSLDVETKIKSYEGTDFEDSDEHKTYLMNQTKDLAKSPDSSNTDESNQCISLNESYSEKDESIKKEVIDGCLPVLSHPVSEIMKGPAVECHEGFTTEYISGYASNHDDALAAKCTEKGILENSKVFTSEHIKGYATECIESSVFESLEDFTSDYVEIDATSCIRNSPTGYVQRSITDWVVGHSTGSFEGHITPIPKCLGNSASESSIQPTIYWLKDPTQEYQKTQGSQASSKSDISKIECLTSASHLSSFNIPLLQSHNYDAPFEDSGVHEYQTSGSFVTSLDRSDKLNRSGYESDHVSLADSVLGLEDQLDRELMQDVDVSSVTYISAQFSPASRITKYPQNQNEHYLNEDSEEVAKCSSYVVPLTWRHTLPRTCSQLKTKKLVSSPKIAGNICKDFEDISKDFAGVKGLIDQWEVIVQEEKLRSLPTSPAVGRKILPPCDEIKGPSLGYFMGEAKNVAEDDSVKESFIPNVGQEKCEELESCDGGSVIEEVASVCDIIQQFEGRVGRLGKMNAHRQRLARGSPSPASRSPSHPRRVATVKPLCEPQIQHEKSLPLQERDTQQHQDNFQGLMEHAVSAGFVPRVVESLSITKSSSEIWEQNPPQASVSNPEGTHEATQIADQQPTLSQDQGLDVEEMSNIMESYTSDGSDLITTTYTTTSIDPDPITSTQTTRIIRRTEIEDGEVKEDVYEEY